MLGRYLQNCALYRYKIIPISHHQLIASGLVRSKHENHDLHMLEKTTFDFN